jgi:hypothetical protein
MFARLPVDNSVGIGEDAAHTTDPIATQIATQIALAALAKCTRSPEKLFTLFTLSPHLSALFAAEDVGSRPGRPAWTLHERSAELPGVIAGLRHAQDGI